jgi:hypothetical protein
MKYGLAMVLRGDKRDSVEAQARQLTNAGCRKAFRDAHLSGAKTDGAQLRRVIDQQEARRLMRRHWVTRPPEISTMLPVT